jgi:hypothetical protein
MIVYKLIKNVFGREFGAMYEKDGFVISFPFAPDNTDYQEYLKWVAAGNTPLPADE